MIIDLHRIIPWRIDRRANPRYRCTGENNEKDDVGSGDPKTRTKHYHVTRSKNFQRKSKTKKTKLKFLSKLERTAVDVSCPARYQSSRGTIK